MRRFLLVLAAWAVVLVRPAPAQSWFETIFPERSKDLGTVARGSKLRHTFRLVNTTNYDVHIADYRTKCGCTEVRIGARDIPPGTQTTIDATIDTTRFQGYKPSGLTLVLDRPTFAEVDLNLTCFIRGDVLLNPGAIDFQTVARGTKPTVALNLNYMGGYENWAVTKLHTISPHVSAQLREISRSPGGGVQYQLLATLNSTASSGYFKDEITLLTNDPGSPSIPVSVSANIQAAVTVSPATLNLGRIRAGEVVKREVLVRSAQAFKVTGFQSAKPELSGEDNGNGQNALSFHKVTLTLKAPSQAGPFNAVLEINTDLKDEPPAKLTAFATVVP
jgi:hypothetical protein